MKMFHGAVRTALRRLAAAALTVCAAISGTAVPAEAAPALPFQLHAPAAVSVKWQPTDETPSACVVSYTKDSELTAYMKHDTDERLAIRQQYGYSELWIKGQLDWSVDSPNDWHYNQYWDTDGYDADWKKHLGDWAYLNFAVTSAKIDSEEIFRSLGNPADASDSQWNGTAEAPGWKSVLKEGQYDIFTAPDGKKGAKIDLTKHQIYVRMRWLVMVNRDDWEREQYLCSDWSQTASVGTLAAKLTSTSAPEDVPETTVTTAELPKLPHLAAPAVTGLHLTGDYSAEGRAIAEFTLQVPEEVSDSAERIKAAGGKLILAASAETDGAENATLIPLDEIPLTVGERRVTFALPECTQCALSWYYCLEVKNPSTGEPVRTAQSDGTDRQNLSVPAQTAATTTGTAPAPKKSSAGKAMRRIGAALLVMAALAGFSVFFLRKYRISIRK